MPPSSKQRKQIDLGAMKSLLWRSIELFWTFFYHELLKRNTLNPLSELCKDHDRAELNRILREWSQRKSNESKYIQIAV